MDVRMREVPARVVVTEQRTGPCRRRAGFHRDLRGQPERGRDGGRVLYPLHADGAAPDGAATRTIPAHREAYVRVLKRTVQSGAVGNVYVAIENWIEGLGLEIAAAPRETYWTDFYSAAADDEVFDVAFPVR